jgi:hypothetical protein
MRYYFLQPADGWKNLKADKAPVPPIGVKAGESGVMVDVSLLLDRVNKKVFFVGRI